MIRTQVQLQPEQLTALRRLSAATGKSIAELIRDSLDHYLPGKHLPSAQERIERAIRVAGRFASGRGDVSSEHDRHLAEAYR